MATQLAEFLKTECPNSFSPEPFYEYLTDSLIYYIKNERSFSRRINKHFTLFLAMSDRSLVGFEIKGLETICRACESEELNRVAGPITLNAEDGERFSLEVLMKFASLKEEVVIENCQYEQLRDATRGRTFRRPEDISSHEGSTC